MERNIRCPSPREARSLSGTSQAALLLNRQFEAVDSLVKTWSRNELRAGVNVIHARSGGNSKEFGGPIYDGELVV